MNKTFSLIFFFLFLGFIAVSKDKIEVDSVSKNRLSPTEIKVIRNLVKKDSLSLPSNLQLELYKFDANLLYKYRLDSIKTEIPLDYNPYVQSFIDVFVAKGKNQIGRMVSLGNYYFPIFEKALEAYNLPKELKYLPIIESALDPHAVSKSGATGLWQFMYITGKSYGLTIDHYIDERKDPIQSSYAAAKYLKEAYLNLGDWLLAVASYNCGQGAVKRAMEKVSGPKTFWTVQEHLPLETRNYIPKFIAVTYMMHYHNRYDDIIVPDANFKINIDSVYVNRHVSFNQLAEVLNIENKELEILNPSYKKGIVNGKPSESKRLIIPKIKHSEYASLFNVLNYGAEPETNLPLVTSEEPKHYQTQKKHIVLKGENLTSIANKYKVEVQDLKVWNNLKNYNIVPGQKLVVTSFSNQSNNKTDTKYLTYTVKIGDTLSSISRKFNGVSVGLIQEINNLSSYTLKPGMVLIINAL